MRLVSYAAGTARAAGAMRGSAVVPLAPLFGTGSAGLDLEDVIAAWPDVACRIEAFVDGEQSVLPLDEVRLLAPLWRPQKIVAIGSNYPRPDGVSGPEGPPVLFFKPPSAIVGPYDPIVLPPEARTVVGEVELALVIGKAGHRIDPARAQDHVFGYTIANDVTAPEILLGESGRNALFLQQSRGKGFRSFCPLGPWIETAAGLPFPPDWELLQDVGDQPEMRGNTRQMTTGIADLVADVSRAFGLEVGDIILTGSPPPQGGQRIALQPGAVLHSKISGIGWIANPVVRE